MTQEQNRNIFSTKYSLQQAREGTYQGTQYAIAELVDNSIDAGLSSNSANPQVEVICIERMTNKFFRIAEILVVDNCGGMGKEMLWNSLRMMEGTNLEFKKGQKTMGKFGVGLPSASLQQCRTTDVYSWQNKEIYRAKLHVADIEASGSEKPNIAAPEHIEKFPKHFYDITNLCNEDAGTIVQWTEIDQADWTTHKGVFNNSLPYLGRVYRHYINDKKVAIRLKAYKQEPSGAYKLLRTEQVLPNDPLFLMSPSMNSEPFNNRPAFFQGKGDEKHKWLGRNFYNQVIHVKTPNGTEGEVRIRLARATDEARQRGPNEHGTYVAAGELPHGKQAWKNRGVSIIREGRELHFEQNSWNKDRDNHLERWWGVEVSFGRELDELFGVKRDKQQFTKFKRDSSKECSENEGISSHEYLASIEATDNDRFWRMKISDKIDFLVDHARKKITLQNVSTDEDDDVIDDDNSVEDPDGWGDNETIDVNLRIKELSKLYEELGFNPEQALNQAEKQINSNIQYEFQSDELDYEVLFSHKTSLGASVITVNSEHPAYVGLTNLLSAKDDVTTPTHEGMRLLVASWVSMERRADKESKREMQRIRRIWGETCAKFYDHHHKVDWE